MKIVAKAAPQAAAPFSLGFAPPKRRHNESTEFTVVALWLAGFSAGSIASTLGMRRTQVLGIAHRSGFENRSEMDDEVRQFHLDELREIRVDEMGQPLDGGALASFNWKIQPISDRRKVRPARRAS